MCLSQLADSLTSVARDNQEPKDGQRIEQSKLAQWYLQSIPEGVLCIPTMEFVLLQEGDNALDQAVKGRLSWSAIRLRSLRGTTWL